jgi:hypothetical protein
MFLPHVTDVTKPIVD